MLCFIQSFASLIIVLGAYCAYAALVVPLVEPAPQQQAGSGGSHSDFDDAPEGKYADLLEDLFPDDHWTHTAPPKVIEMGQGMFVFQDIHPDDRGRVTVEPCVMIHFPTPWSRTKGPPPRDAIILEAPKGGVIQLDGSLKVARREFGNIAERIEHAWLNGPVVIHSDMQKQGPSDDLAISTENVLINNRRIWSNAKVDFRLGEHHGSGEKLEIRFLDADDTIQRDGFSITGIHSIKLLENVELTMRSDDLVAGNPFDLSDRVQDDMPRSRSSNEINLTCDGPLFVNVPARVIEFERDVEVFFIHSAGPSDKLACEYLRVFFEEARLTPNTVATTQVPQSGEPLPAPSVHADELQNSRQRSFTQHSMGLEPVRLEAVGQPVTITSVHRNARGLCRKLVYDLRGRRMLLEALTEESLAGRMERHAGRLIGLSDLKPEEICRLQLGSHSIEASRIEYGFHMQRPRTQLGTFRVFGPGRLTAAVESETSTQALRATWHEGLQLIRQEGDPVVSLFGRPVIEWNNGSRLAAGDLHLWLRETEVAETATTETGGHGETSSLQLEPTRLLARQEVEVNSPQVTARVGQLETWFVSGESPLDQAGGLNLRADGRSPHQKTKSYAFVDDGEDIKKSYYVEADRLQIRAVMPESSAADHPRRVDVTHISLQGSVRLEQQPLPPQTAPPIWIEGDWLHIADADKKSMMVHARGRPVVAHANGSTLRGAEINFDQARNRFEVPTQGDLSVQVDRDLDGRPLDLAIPLTVSWAGTLSFDGKEAIVTDRVHARTPDQRLQTQQLIASLKSTVPLERMGFDEGVHVERLECTGGVILDRQTFDAGRLASQEHAELPNLTIERESGQIHGDGPGWLRSVRIANGTHSQSGRRSERPHVLLGSIPDHDPTHSVEIRNAAYTSLGSGSKNPLAYLRVDFQRQMNGQLDRREISFEGQVHCVRGPIASWDEVLHVSGVPQLPEDTIVLHAATLRVNQWKRDGNQWHGLEAEGNVEVEGGLGTNGIFTARGSRLTYDQSKDLIVLDGAGGTAELVREASLGGPRQTSRARSIQFSPSRNWIGVNDLRYGGFDLSPRE